MKARLKATPASGLKMGKMELKVSWMPIENVILIWDDNDYSWYQRRFQEEEEHRKEDEHVEKKKEEEKVILQKMRSTGPRMNGKEMNQRIEIEETAWQSQGWDEWQSDYYDEYGHFQAKGKTGKKGKGKGKKRHGPQDQGKGQG